jgi:L-lactate dehydrogenase
MVTAGAKQKPGQSRIDLAEATINLVKTILPPLLEVAPNATYVMVTNPVDVVTYAALKITGLPRHQLFGSGTVLDSSRLRYVLARELGVAVQNVHAYMAGEHGDSEIPLWSSATIGGVPLLDWPGINGRGPLTEAQREAIANEVITSAYSIIEGKGATNYAVALAGSRIIEALLKDENRVLPVSTLVDNYFSITDVCLSIPTVVGGRGAAEQLRVPLSNAEYDGLKSSAQKLKEVARQFGY